MERVYVFMDNRMLRICTATNKPKLLSFTYDQSDHNTVNSHQVLDVLLWEDDWMMSQSHLHLLFEDAQVLA